MATTDPPTIEGVRGMMVHVGLATPLSRAFVAGAAVGIAAYAIKWPGASFDEEGSMRPLSLVSKDPTATQAHFLAVPIGAAAIAYLFT